MLCYTAGTILGIDLSQLHFLKVNQQGEINQKPLRLFGSPNTPEDRLEPVYLSTVRELFNSFFLPALMHIHILRPSDIGEEEYLEFLLKSITAIQAYHPIFEADSTLCQMFLHSHMLPLMDDLVSIASNMEAHSLLRVHTIISTLVSSVVSAFLRCDQSCIAILSVLIDHFDELFAVQSINILYCEWTLCLDYKSKDLVNQGVQTILRASAQTMASNMLKGFKDIPKIDHAKLLQAYYLIRVSSQLLTSILTINYLFLASEVLYNLSSGSRQLGLIISQGHRSSHNIR